MEVQATNLGIPVPEFIRMMRTMVIEKIATEVFKKLIYEQVGETKMDAVAMALLGNMISSAGRKDFACRLEANKPLIGIGAPVGAYLPGVAERFHTDLVLPEHSEVGNAAGAISGNVMETIDMLIKPKKGLGALDNPPCTLYWMEEKKDFDNLEEALAYASSVGGRLVRERALTSGADQVEITIEDNRKQVKPENGWGGNILLEVNLSITGIGKPRLFFEAER